MAKPKPGVPYLIERPNQKMAVMKAKGDPNVVCAKYLPALYSTVYGLRKTMGKFKVEKLRARWPVFEDTPKDQWIGLYALPIPEKTKSLLAQNKVPGVIVALENWAYGQLAEILHIGSYTEEAPNIAKLKQFIADSGYQIVGEHEEKYLSDPRKTAKNKLQTIIRYRVEKK
mgnify:CR=1 FL=1